MQQAFGGIAEWIWFLAACGLVTFFLRRYVASSDSLVAEVKLLTNQISMLRLEMVKEYATKEQFMSLEQRLWAAQQCDAVDCPVKRVS